jgi:hypothetical protein
MKQGGIAIHLQTFSRPVASRSWFLVLGCCSLVYVSRSAQALGSEPRQTPPPPEHFHPDARASRLAMRSASDPDDPISHNASSAISESHWHGIQCGAAAGSSASVDIDLGGKNANSSRIAATADAAAGRSSNLL